MQTQGGQKQLENLRGKSGPGRLRLKTIELAYLFGLPMKRGVDPGRVCFSAMRASGSSNLAIAMH